MFLSFLLKWLVLSGKCAVASSKHVSSQWFASAVVKLYGQWSSCGCRAGVAIVFAMKSILMDDSNDNIRFNTIKLSIRCTTEQGGVKYLHAHDFLWCLLLSLYQAFYLLFSCEHFGVITARKIIVKTFKYK